MGKFVSKDEAARLLGVSGRTVYRLINKGHLRPVREGRQLGVWEEDILQYRRVRDAAGGEAALPVNKTTLAMLASEIRTLETQVATCMKLLGVRYEALNLTDPELAALHQMAAHYATEGWPPHVEETWADTFQRLRYGDLLRLADVSEDKHPWVPFLKLCDTMRLATYDRELRGRLEHGRDNLYALALLWGQLTGEAYKAVELVMKHDAAARKVVVRRVERGRDAAAMSVPAELASSSGTKPQI